MRFHTIRKNDMNFITLHYYATIVLLVGPVDVTAKLAV